MRTGLITVVAIGALAGTALTGGLGGTLMGLGLGWFVGKRMGTDHEPFSATLVQVATETVGSPADSLAVEALIRFPASNRPNWCALAVQGWIRRASELRGVPMPIAGDAGAIRTGEQFKDKPHLKWHSADELRQTPHTMRGGMVATWRRVPPSGVWNGEGHIGIVISVDYRHSSFTTVEGNNGPTIATHSHDLSAANFLGMGEFLS